MTVGKTLAHFLCDNTDSYHLYEKKSNQIKSAFMKTKPKKKKALWDTRILTIFSIHDLFSLVYYKFLQDDWYRACIEEI